MQEEQLESNDEQLQPQDEVVTNEVTEVEDELPAGSESDSDGEHEVKDATQAKVEERIGELTRKRKEAEKLAEDRFKQLQELQSQVLESQQPVVPDLPDPDMVSDADFQEAVRKRDKAITDRVAWEQRKQSYDNEQQTRQQQTQHEKMQNLAQASDNYTKRAKALGITPEELSQAGQTIAQVGLSDDVAMHILQDENGAAITKYLANNVVDLLEVAHSDPIRAALYIERKVKPKLTAQKRKSNTPAPQNRVTGGTPNLKDRYPLTSGAKFE